jgi:hypothetical protein
LKIASRRRLGSLPAHLSCDNRLDLTADPDTALRVDCDLDATVAAHFAALADDVVAISLG